MNRTEHVEKKTLHHQRGKVAVDGADRTRLMAIGG
jgi:hypothetical protein